MRASQMVFVHLPARISFDFENNGIQASGDKEEASETRFKS